MGVSRPAPLRPVLAVLAVVTAGFLVYGFAVGSPFVGFYVPVTALAAAALGLVHRSVRFPTPLGWSLAAVAVGNLAGGVLLVGGDPLYVHRFGGVVPYDLVYHAAASAVAGWAALVVLEAWQGAGRSRLTTGIIAVLVTTGGGAFVEIVEFTGTLLFPGTNVGDYRNNMLDLLANLGGAVLGTVLILTVRRPAVGAGRM